MNLENDDYYRVARRKEVREESRKLRKMFLRYKEAEILYSIQHKKLLELADAAGAVYKMGIRFVRIRRDVFEEYLRYRKEMLDEGENQLPGCDDVHPETGERES